MYAAFTPPLAHPAALVVEPAQQLDQGCCPVPSVVTGNGLVSVFLSQPTPFLQSQVRFLDALRAFMLQRGLNPRTLAVTDFDFQEPLAGVRRLMTECNGLIAVALRVSFIEKGTRRPNSDLTPPLPPTDLSGFWFTSPFIQIETAMAFEIGLPILVLREAGVFPEGVTQIGIPDLTIPDFDSNNPPEDFLCSDQFRQMFLKWETRVLEVYDRKGHPRYWTVGAPR